jgi:hypothetical protein
MTYIINFSTALELLQALCAKGAGNLNTTKKYTYSLEWQFVYRENDSLKIDLIFVYVANPQHLKGRTLALVLKLILFVVLKQIE